MSKVNKQTNNCSPAALFVSEWCTNHGIIKQQKTTSASSFTEIDDVGEDTETYALRKRKKKKRKEKNAAHFRCCCCCWTKQMYINT